MDNDFLIGLGIDDEVVKKILDKFNETKSQENEVKEKLLTAEETIKNLEEKLQHYSGIDIEKLTQDALFWEDKYKKHKLDTAIDAAILKAKGRNIKAIKALIDIDKISFNENGELEGFDIEDLKKSDSYLFDIETIKNQGSGFNQGKNYSMNEELNAQVARAMGVKS